MYYLKYFYILSLTLFYCLAVVRLMDRDFYLFLMEKYE